MAYRSSATANSWQGSRGGSLRDCLLLAACAVAVLSPGRAVAASNVRLTGLSDVGFGTIANLGTDALNAQSVCAYSNSPTNGYRVTATGSGTGNAFTLASGGRRLAYEVQWSQQAGQTTGTQLTAGVPLTGLISTATQQACNAGPITSASLIIVARASQLSTATAGAYSGTLTLLIGPE